MGRNGKNPAIFGSMIEVVNLNVGKTLTSEQLLLGQKPSCKGVATNYVYKFIKLGYIRLLSGKVTSPDATYKVLKAFPPGYSSSVFTDELKLMNGKAVRYEESLRVLKKG